jgi:hypothetical protein
VTGSKKSVTKSNDQLIFITVLYPYVLLCISANGLVFLHTFFGEK